MRTFRSFLPPLAPPVARVLPALAALVLCACSVGPDYRREPMDLGSQFMHAKTIDSSAPFLANAQDDLAWWQAFNDPLLASLIARAQAGNTEIAAALARVEQSRAAALGAQAALLPRAAADADAQRLRQSLRTPLGVVGERMGFPRDYSQYALGAQASWEIDLAGGLSRAREAAQADYAAARMRADGVRIVIAAETADAYLTVRELQARLASVQGQQEKQRSLAELIGRRVDKGLSAERELHRAIAEAERIDAQAAPLRAALAAQLNRLDVLTGAQPGAGQAALLAVAAIPLAPLPAGSAAPRDLLRRRPDVAAAEQRLMAADARIGVALAEYYPKLSLAGLLGVASVGTSNLFSSQAVQATGGLGLRWRLFDFGRVDAEVAQARGVRAEALAQWRGAVLGAAEDVENALSRLQEAHAERASLLRQIAALEKARAQTQKAYQSGVVALLDVLDADRGLLAAQERLSTVRAEEARAAVAAYRALGGGWHAEEAGNTASTLPGATAGKPAADINVGDNSGIDAPQALASKGRSYTN